MEKGDETALLHPHRGKTKRQELSEAALREDERCFSRAWRSASAKQTQAHQRLLSSQGNLQDRLHALQGLQNRTKR